MTSHPTQITVVTTPTGEINVPTKTSPPTPLPDMAIPYRIEEHRRTIYLTSPLQHGKWDAKALGELLSIPDIPDEADAQTQRHRRVKSLNDYDLTVFSDSSSQKPKEASTSSPCTFRPGTHLGIPKNGGLSTPTTPTTSIRAGSPRTPTRHRILFYHKHDPHYGFTNFSAHPVIYNSKRYPTSEHLFQSFKFQSHRPNLAEHIRTCSERPSVAFSQARRFQPEVRFDWMTVNIQKMDETLWYKFTQHADLREELLSTGDAELVEDSDKDEFWGVGSDRRGRNELGKALERLRTKLRET